MLLTYCPICQEIRKSYLLRSHRVDVFHTLKRVRHYVEIVVFPQDVFRLYLKVDERFLGSVDMSSQHSMNGHYQVWFVNFLDKSAKGLSDSVQEC